jgi:hypothetical protein
MCRMLRNSHSFSPRNPRWLLQKPSGPCFKRLVDWGGGTSVWCAARSGTTEIDTIDRKAAICKDAFMRTTVDLPDELLRRAKARAALQGCSLKDLVADGLRLVLQTPSARSRIPSRRTQFPIIKPKDPARRLTSEMVAAAEEELLDEEAAAHGRLAGH